MQRFKDSQDNLGKNKVQGPIPPDYQDFLKIKYSSNKARVDEYGNVTK